MSEFRHFSSLAHPLRCIGHRANTMPGNTQNGEFYMSTETSILHRAMAGVASLAITVAILASYFATPAMQSVSTVLA